MEREVRYVLDTNSYALIFQSPKGDAYTKLESRLKHEGVVSFYLPEIVAMEIHSVIGKYRRGGAETQHEKCARTILAEPMPIQCGNTCVHQGRPRMKIKIFRMIQKLLCDIENKRGDIQATLLEVGKREFEEGRRMLLTYSHQFAFGSHDALIAGTVAVAKENGNDFVLVTSDKSLKAVCEIQGIRIFDPLKDD